MLRILSGSSLGAGISADQLADGSFILARQVNWNSVGWYRAPSGPSGQENGFSGLNQVGHSQPDVIALEGGGWAFLFQTYSGGPAFIGSFRVSIDFYDAASQLENRLIIPDALDADAVASGNQVILVSQRLDYIDYGQVADPNQVLSLSLVTSTSITTVEVDADPGGSGAQASVALTADRVLVAWRDQAGDLGDPSAVHARLFTTSGEAVSAEFRVNTSADGNVSRVEAAALGSGFVVAWINSAPNGSQLRAQRLDASGTLVGPEIFVADTAAGQIRILDLEDGSFLIAWESEEGLQTQIVGPSGELRGDAVVLAEAGTLVSLDLRPDGLVQVVWSRDGQLYLDVAAPPRWLSGTATADILDGGIGHDRLDGSHGDDELSGGEGDDTLIGGMGDDILSGGAGDDQLQTGEGDDQVVGGTGTDTAVFDGPRSNYTVTASPDGTVTVSGPNGTTVLQGVEYARFADERMTLVSTESTGTAAGEVIIGNDGADTVFALGGNDEVYAEGGDDLVYGGDGSDIIGGGRGDDTMLGGAGNDGLYGEAGVDILIGEAGDDVLAGGDGDDLIEAGADNDHLYGEAGDDFLDGGFGHDLLSGSSGQDSLYGGDGHDELYGGLGRDLLAGGSGDDVGGGGGGRDFLYGEEGDDALYGEEGDDIVSGGLGADLAAGGAGQDNVVGGHGADALYGEAGADVLEAGEDDDLAGGGDGDDFIYGESGADRLYGDNGADLIGGGEGADFIDGGNGDDQLYGEAGDDELWGYSGENVLSGGDGADVLYSYSGVSSLTGGAGDDRLVGGQSRSDTAYYEGTRAQYSIVEASDGRIYISGPDGADVLESIAFVQFSDQRVSLSVYQYGTAWENTLYGGEGNDIIMAWSGDDFIQGHGGDDQLFGGADDDVLRDATGSDFLSGETGDDRLYAGTGEDRLFGGEGSDVLEGEAGGDELHGESGNDLLRGGDGEDLLVGGTGDDVIYGDAGTDTAGYTGLRSAYTVTIGAGFVTVSGAEGTDTLYGVERIRFGDGEEVVLPSSAADDGALVLPVEESSKFAQGDDAIVCPVFEDDTKPLQPHTLPGLDPLDDPLVLMPGVGPKTADDAPVVFEASDMAPLTPFAFIMDTDSQLSGRPLHRFHQQPGAYDWVG